MVVLLRGTPGEHQELCKSRFFYPPARAEALAELSGTRAWMLVP